MTESSFFRGFLGLDVSDDAVREFIGTSPEIKCCHSPDGLYSEVPCGAPRLSFHHDIIGDVEQGH